MSVWLACSRLGLVRRGACVREGRLWDVWILLVTLSSASSVLLIRGVFRLFLVILRCRVVERAL